MREWKKEGEGKYGLAKLVMAYDRMLSWHQIADPAWLMLGALCQNLKHADCSAKVASTCMQMKRGLHGFVTMAQTLSMHTKQLQRSWATYYWTVTKMDCDWLCAGQWCMGKVFASVFVWQTTRSERPSVIAMYWCSCESSHCSNKRPGVNYNRELDDSLTSHSQFLQAYTDKQVIGEWERANLVVQLERFFSLYIYFYPTTLCFGPGGAPALHANVKLARSHPVIW